MRGLPRCRVFDDVFSLIHLLAGAILAIIGKPGCIVGGFTFYTLYEVIEGRYERDCPAADILEFLVGLGVGVLAKAALALFIYMP